MWIYICCRDVAFGIWEPVTQSQSPMSLIIKERGSHMLLRDHLNGRKTSLKTNSFLVQHIPKGVVDCKSSFIPERFIFTTLAKMILFFEYKTPRICLLNVFTYQIMYKSMCFANIKHRESLHGKGIAMFKIN